jgi:hypothetical protein
MSRKKILLPNVTTHHAKTGATIYDVRSRMERGEIIHKFCAGLTFGYLGAYVPGEHQDHLLPRSKRRGMKAAQDKARLVALHEFARHPWKRLLREHASCELGPTSCCIADQHRLHFPTGIADRAFGIQGEPTRLVFHDYPDGRTMIEAYVWTRNRGPLVLVYLDASDAIGHPRLHGVYVDREINGYLIGRAEVIEDEAEASGYQLHGRLIETIAEVYHQRPRSKRPRCRPAPRHPERCIAQKHGKQPDLSQYEAVLAPTY